MDNLKKCCIEECDRKYYALEYCQSHYYRLRKYGDSLATPIRKAIEIEDKYKVVDEVKHKKCGECNEYHPMNNNFFYSKKTLDGYNTYCIPCTFKRAKEWVERNPEKYNEQMKRKVQNKTDIQRQWSRDSANKNRLNGYNKRWARENKDKLRKYNLQRANKNHNISKQEWLDCRKYFDYTCAYCGISEEEAKETQRNFLHKEHVINDGADDLSNCVPACKSCNSRKWEYVFEEWYTEDNPVYSMKRLERVNTWLKGDYMEYQI